MVVTSSYTDVETGAFERWRERPHHNAKTIIKVERLAPSKRRRC